MKRTAAFFVVAGSFVLIAVLALAGLLVQKVPPPTIGVKQNLLGGGIVDEDYGVGYHLGIAFVHKWHLLDGRVHFINFSKEQDHGKYADTNVENTGSLDIRTRDNNTASLDVTVTYRIKDGEAHRIVADGIEFDYSNKVLLTVRGLLMEELTKLSPEDLVNTDVRLQRVEETRPLLDEALAQYHVVCESVLVRAVRFPVDYESKLQAKQLTRQDALLALARQRQEKQRQVTEAYEKETEALEKRLRGEWDVKLQEARSDNEVKVAEILAESRVYDQETRANAEADYVSSIATGQLEVAKAEALRDELRNAALDSEGGRILLAKQAAENLDIAEVTLNSNDPAVPTVLDVGAMVDLLLGRRSDREPSSRE
ncbi:MAG: SPFH domain-containing protein [Planctomycetota bacterium]